MQHDKIEKHVVAFTAADLEEFIRSRVRQMVGPSLSNGDRDKVDKAAVVWLPRPRTTGRGRGSIPPETILARIEVA